MKIAVICYLNLSPEHTEIDPGLDSLSLFWTVLESVLAF